MDSTGELMGELPVTGAVAEYRGKRYPVAFSGDDWVALRADPADVPDAFEYGESSAVQARHEPWAKVRRSAIDGLIHVRARGKIAGHTVSLRRRLPDGRIGIEFVGPPRVARELGLEGDQYMGWTGIVAAEDLTDIQVEETRRA
ncbi:MULTISPECIES: hypothetical protein [Mycolicibacterium]|uniref:hypothetical protein n=1 Tax=Mycolicibacterium monacense TaxID=85693 RepID=UPI00161FB386|nr:hypothetical protein [Mycolicibacterium monacense]